MRSLAAMSIDPAFLLRAIEVYEVDRIDLAEAYLVAHAESSGVGEIASFDSPSTESPPFGATNHHRHDNCTRMPHTVATNGSERNFWCPSSPLTSPTVPCCLWSALESSTLRDLVFCALVERVTEV
jgi:hypothetical protein